MKYIYGTLILCLLSVIGISGFFLTTDLTPLIFFMVLGIAFRCCIKDMYEDE